MCQMPRSSKPRSRKRFSLAPVLFRDSPIEGRGVFARRVTDRYPLLPAVIYAAAIWAIWGWSGLAPRS